MHLRPSLFCLLLLVSLALALPCAAQSEPALAGRWEGVVPIPGESLALVLDLDRTPQGAWTGSCIVPAGFGVAGAPVKDIAWKDGALTLALPPLGDAKLTLRPVASGLEGRLESGGNSAPVTLARTGPPRVELPPASTPVSPAYLGVWTALLDLSGAKLRVDLTLANQPSGPATGALKVVEPGNSTFPFSLITESHGQLRFRSESPGFEYEGRLSKTGDAIEGRLYVNGTDTVLRFERPTAPSQPAK